MKRSANVTRSFILCFGLLLANCTFAATFVVNIAADDADAHDINPGNGICEDSLGTCTLRAAIEEANALAKLHVPETVTLDSPETSGGLLDHVLPQGTTQGWLTAVVRNADGNNSEFAPGLMFGEVSDILFTDSFESTN